MESVKQKIICIKYCFKVGKTAAETHSMLCEVYGDDASIQMMTYEWFTCFKNGTTSVDDNERSNLAQVKNIIHGNC
jgi:hypothetical protein